MRVHLPGLPHTDTVADTWDTCAFTTKIRHLARMLTDLDHDVILYGSEHNDTPASEHVVCVTDKMRRGWWGAPAWDAAVVFDDWDARSPCWVDSTTAVIRRMANRMEPGDLIALPIGSIQADIAMAFPGNIALESGVGYEGSFAPYRAFESVAWQHHTYGRQGIHDGRYYDVVIPNAVDSDAFHVATPEDYILFLGRHTARKGLGVVLEVARHHRVITAGQGGPIPGVEHVGVVTGHARADLIARARLLLAPTGYIEPWGGVAVEAQMSGTPVIASPWGGFTENVQEGLTGYLPHTLGEILAAVPRCDALDRPLIRASAEAQFSLAAVAPQYDTWLSRLAALNDRGWYTV